MAISEVVLQNFLNPKGVAYYDNEYEKARTNELANDKLRFERQQANALRSAVQGFGNDQQANRQAVIGTGSHEALNTFDTQQNAQAKALLEAQKGQREAQEATDKRLNAQQAAYFNKTALIDGPEKLSAWVQGSKGLDLFDDDEIVAYTNMLQQQPERWQEILAAVRKFGSPLEKQFNEALERDKLGQKKEHDDASLVQPELRPENAGLTKILNDRARLGASRSTTNIDLKAHSKEQEEISKGLGQLYSRLTDQAFAATTKLGKLARLESLASGAYTGRFAVTALELAKAAKPFGIELDPKLGAKQAFIALANEMALELRNTGDGNGMPGQLSNQDREFLVNMVPNITMDAEGIRLIIETNRRLLKRQQDVAKKMKAYRKQHNTIDGFEQEMAEWTEQNPLFEPGPVQPAPTTQSGARVKW